MPRVLILANSGNIVGGGELSLLGLLGALDRERYDPTVVCPFEGSLVPRLRALGVPVCLAPMPTLRQVPPVAALRAVPAFVRLLRQGFDLVHANGSRCMVYGGVAARWAGAPCIWHVRIIERDRWLDAPLAALASAIVANSLATAQRFRFAHWAAAKVTVIHNGVDVAAFQAAPRPSPLRTAWGGASGLRLVGNVSRLVPFKGQRYFLRAAALLAMQHKEVRFIVVGDGPLRGELEEEARRLGLGARLHFAGHREDIPNVMAALDVFVLSSLEEHFGRVLIEAMAAETPVVATAAGGVPEIIEDGRSGILVPPGDADALADAISRLLCDEALRRSVAEAGARRVASHFSIQQHAERVERLYARLLSGRTPGRSPA